MGRLDTDRQKKLEPIRIKNAVKKIEALGYEIDSTTITSICFKYKGKGILFYPYSGWHTGASIKDGRGLKKLLKQIR